MNKLSEPAIKRDLIHEAEEALSQSGLLATSKLYLVLLNLIIELRRLRDSGANSEGH